MISRLTLNNFRRHEHTDIVLDDSDGIVAVSGANGAGKSTILEAIEFALFGQTRHGARGIDQLVRRGAEHEGMQVTLEFTLGEVLYTVERRRDKKVSSAALKVNDLPLVEGVKAVTDTITNLLGTDALGFRHAAVAQQKELDALVKLSAAERMKVVKRLLRLDAVVRAKDETRQQHRKIVNVLAELPTPEDRAELAARIAEADAAVAAAENAESQTRAYIKELESQLEANAAVDELFNAANAKFNAAELQLRNAERDHLRLTSDLAGIAIPDVADTNVDIELLTARSADIQQEISKAENAKLLKERDALAAKDAAAAQQIVTQHAKFLQSTNEDQLQTDIAHAETALCDATAGVTARRSEENDARTALAVAQEQHIQARKRVEAFAVLDDVCDTCGQDITHEHKSRLHQSAEDDYRAAAEVAQTSSEQLTAAQTAVAAAEAALVCATTAVNDAQERERQYFEAKKAVLDASQRVNAYNVRAENFADPGEFDLAGLHAEKTALMQEIREAKHTEEVRAARLRAEARRDELQTQVDAAAVRVNDAEAHLAASRVDPTLQTAWRTYRDTLDAHRAELGVLSELTGNVEQARGRRDLVKQQQAQNEAAVAKREELQTKGHALALGKQLLEELGRQLDSDVIPSLESSASEFLTMLSNGRYTTVALDDTYLPSVEDAGSMQPLSEFSGGEQDLVALALRLAVADLVAERNESAGGFLILDEVLGSQDDERREAILSGLRNLRSRYEQIWTISHVGGIDDASDRVLNVELTSAGIAQIT